MIRKFFVLFLFLGSMQIIGDARVKIIGNTMHVVNSWGFFRQISPIKFEKINVRNLNFTAHMLSVNDSTGYIALGNLIYKTTNSGENWDLLKTTSSAISSILAKQNELHFIINETSLYSSFDYGNTWTSTGINFSSGYGGFVLAAIRAPRILYLSSEHWYWGRQMYTSTFPYSGWDSNNNSLRYLDFVTSNFGYDHTTGLNITYNGGNSWIQLSPGWNATAVTALSPSILYIGTDTPSILKFTFPYINFALITNLIPGTNITSIAANSNVLAYTIKNSNLVYASYDEGINWTSFNPFLLTEIEDDNVINYKFVLEQNYPNPFNPTTTISFSLKEEGLVSLKVFNLLGEEVAILVDENKPGGEYKYNFDGIDLTSGVYVYLFKVNDNVSTKKMLLIK